MSNVTRGRLRLPMFIVLHGTEGVGKTTFALGAPDAVFLDFHDGTAFLDVWARVSWAGEKPSWPRAKALIQDGAKVPGVRTLVIDCADDLEPLIWAEAIADSNRRARADQQAKNIEEVGGGFRKGYTHALTLWRELVDLLEDIRRRGIHVIVLAHSRPAKMKNPGGEEYMRWALKVDELAAAVFRERAEAVLFAQQVIRATRPNAKPGNRAPVLEDERVMHTTRREGWDAKNRLGLPATMALDFRSLWRAREAHFAGGGKALDSDLDAELAEALAQLPEALRLHAGTGEPLLEVARKSPDEARAILNWAQREVRQREAPTVDPTAEDPPEDPQDMADGLQAAVDVPEDPPHAPAAPAAPAPTTAPAAGAPAGAGPASTSMGATTAEPPSGKQRSRVKRPAKPPAPTADPAGAPPKAEVMA